MKKILTFFALIGVVLLISGCGTSTTTSTITTTTDDAARKNQDFWPYTGQEIIVNQTKDMADFKVTLNKIIIGNTNFGKYEDGYASAIISGYTYKWVMGDFTITSKIDAGNIDSLQFGIGRKKNTGGETFNAAVFSWQLTTWAQKFGFYQDGYSIPLAKGESKNIKVIISLMNQFSGNGPYTFNIGDEHHLTDDKRILLEFPIDYNLDN